MPAVTKAFNLDQAHSTLALCSNKLSARFSLWAEPAGSGVDAAWEAAQNFPAQGRLFRAWLERWERAFSALLAAAVSAMPDAELRQCRVLKANHLACFVRASLLESSSYSADDDDDRAMLIQSLDRDCRAILGLAVAVLQAPQQHHSPSDPAADMTFADPLSVVESYGPEQSLRTQAAHLLARFFDDPRGGGAGRELSSASMLLVGPSSPAALQRHVTAPWHVQ